MGVDATAGANAGLATIGVSSYDSADFIVTAGFVQLAVGSTGIDSIGVDSSTPPGTNPVIPNGVGLVTINGAIVANHAVPIETHSRSVNHLNIELQQAATAGASTPSLSGAAHFSSTQFTVDINGFVQLLGGSEAIDSIAVQTGTSPIVPTVAGLVTINGAVVAAGTHPVRSDGTGLNTMALEVQISQAIASTDATKIGLCAFNSGQFSVDVNGFVSTTGTTILTVTPLVHGASPYTVLTTDEFLAISNSVGTFTVKLPNAPATGRVFIIKDTNGSAFSFNIAVTTVGGAVNIDGATTYTMATNYQSISVCFDGSSYNIF